jgi:16S rRNA (cytosine967-C5)-methyltransferase
VLRTGAYSNVVLGRLGSSADDRLIRRLVYGTLRHLVAVDEILARASNRPLPDIDSPVLDTLRIGAWELRFGEGAAHAAVDEAVAAARARSGRGAGGFVNAVLRAVQSDTASELSAAARLGVPEWIRQRLIAAWGSAEAEAFLEASLQPAPRTVRLRPGAEAGRSVAPIAGAATVEAVGPRMVVMDPSSVAVGLAAAVEPGMAVLDMAAAPGGKTLHLADDMEITPTGSEGLLVASDRHERRVASARRRLRDLGLDLPWLVADGRHLPFPPEVFHRVLLDAPCTGLGTLRRRPEIRHRLAPEDPGRAGARQRQLLSEALRVVRPDGFVVYAACTVFPEETVDVVAGFSARPPEGLPGLAAGNGWLLGPHLTGSDGMFISLVQA